MNMLPSGRESETCQHPISVLEVDPLKCSLCSKKRVAGVLGKLAIKISDRLKNSLNDFGSLVE